MRRLSGRAWVWGAGLLVAYGIVGTPTGVLAGGFALIEQSVTGLGNAFAGGSAIATDATTIFFNPAGLTRLPGISAVNAAYVISPSAQFKNQGSTLFSGAPLQGSEGGDAGTGIAIGNFYTAWSLSDRFKLGLGVSVPFGLVTYYKDNWVGRYQAVESRLSTININPTVAAKLTDTLSLGAGLNVQYAAATLSNAIDFGSIGRSVGLPTVPQRSDGFVKILGEDWSVGYNLGILYEPTPTTRFGLAYRSAIDHTLRGNADFTVPTNLTALTRTGRFTDTGASAPLKLPDTLSLSAYHEISPRWAVMGDITWTNWSRFEELRIDYDNPAQPSTIQPENWEDTFRLSAGVNYTVNKALILRTGIAYDPTPVKDEFRTARIPDGDRLWLAVGASYRPSEALSINVGYAHLFVGDAPINEGSATTGILRGEYDSSVNIVGVQVNWQF